MGGFLILESLLLSSSITKIISDFTIKSGYLGKIMQIPAVKLIDYLNFPLFILLAFSVFIICYLLTKKRIQEKLNSRSLVFESGYLLCYIVIFWQSYFVFSSGRNLLIFIFVVYLSQFILRKFVKSEGSLKFMPRILLNGVLTGFFLSMLTSHLTKLTAVPLSLAMVTPFLYVYLQPKLNNILSNPLHLIFVVSVFFSTDIRLLLVLLTINSVMIIVSQKYWDLKEEKGKIINFFYITSLIFIFTYNPLFYIGHFDSVEEGFWLAWIERLADGQIMYRDFFAFHFHPTTFANW